MKKICLYFEIHQIIHLKRYRFFDIKHLYRCVRIILSLKWHSPSQA